MTQVNHHGSLVIAGESGVFITGPSGAGKTTLALALHRHCAGYGRIAQFVCDDQVFLSAAAGRLIGHAPATIGGLVEARGLGPAPMVHESRAVIDLLVRLVPAEEAPRIDDNVQVMLEGVPLPCLQLARLDAQGAVNALAARLSLPPFA